MCLFIDNKHKSWLTGKYKAKYANKDIWVWKVLRESCFCEQLVTPFQCKKIYFKDGKCELETFSKKDFEKSVHYCYKKPFKAELGYHALLTHIPCYGTEKIFRAKIPRGSYYYIGTENDICSNKLIIYEK